MALKKIKKFRWQPAPREILLLKRNLIPQRLFLAPLSKPPQSVYN